MVVEHDMTFVRELGVKVTCLHEGTVLAEGTIDQVSSNERCQSKCIWDSAMESGHSLFDRIAEDAMSSNNISLYYGAAQALRGVSLKAEPGKVTCVLGRNGVGKTSLLRAMVGQYPIAERLDHARRRRHHRPEAL